MAEELARKELLLRELVVTIANRTGLLLELVNYNVEGEFIPIYISLLLVVMLEGVLEEERGRRRKNERADHLSHFLLLGFNLIYRNCE